MTAASFPRQLRAVILRRDPMCVVCQLRPSVEADHIQCVAEGGLHTITNGRGICIECHIRKTTAEANRGRARVSTKRKPERHPGLL